MRTQTLDDIIEDLFYTESILTKSDTLIVIVDTEPNDTMIDRLNYLYDHDGIFIVMYNIKRLLFNILKHERVPSIEVLDQKDTEEMMKKYNVKHTAQLPEISRYDPLAMAVCMRPGEVCKLIRKSPTALSTIYYRVCK
jgi:DNA-directed RNA polymerase subunit H